MGDSVGTDVVCLIAAALHSLIFARAVACVWLSGVGCADALCLATLRRTSVAVGAAYAWDLFSIRGLGIVPLSRCRTGDDIVGHHVPVLCVMMPLGLPFCCGWRGWEPACAVAIMPRLVLFAEGTGFLSSLNEAIMCLQKVRGVRAVARSFGAVAFELVYKVLIFSVMALAILVGCLAIQYHVFVRCREVHAGDARALVAAVLSSPVLLRSLVYGWFVLSKYPVMGRRAIRKLRAHVETGDGAPPLDWADVPKGRSSSNLCDIVAAPPDGKPKAH